MIINDGGAVGWGPTATIDPADKRCTIPSLASTSTTPDIPSFPLVGSGPLGLTTVLEYLPPSDPGRPGDNVAARCIHMNPKLSEFDKDGVPHAMWAYLWTHDPATGCHLPTGDFVDAGYYVYRINKQDPGAGWQLDLASGKAEVNQTRGQAMKKEYGVQHQVRRWLRP
jgi:hypothetical protein